MTIATDTRATRLYWTTGSRGATASLATRVGDDLILDSTLADTRPRRPRRHRFRELLQAALAAAPTTLVEDRAMWKETTTLEEGYGLLRAESARLFHALTYRIGQKALMTKMLEALESDNPEDALETVRLV